MELKQLEYLIAAVEYKSLSRAAEHLYTSQPNVSKILSSLEKELDVKILERSSKGVTLTKVGEQIYVYAKNMLQTSQLIATVADDKSYDQLKIASYSSNMIANKLADYYKSKSNKRIHVEYLSGTMEEVVDYVASRKANIGMVFYPDYQKQAFGQVLQHKDLQFHLLKKCKMCLYVGPAHPYYEKDQIEFEDLKDLEFIQWRKEYFSPEDYIDILSKKKLRASDLNHTIHTNSEHVMKNILEKTKVCNLGLDLIDEADRYPSIKKIELDGCDHFLRVGYVIRDSYTLTEHEQSFLSYVNRLF